MGPQQGRMMDPMSGSGGMMGGFNPSYQGGPQAGAMMGGGMPPQTSFMPNQGTGQPAPQYTSNPQRYGLVFFFSCSLRHHH